MAHITIRNEWPHLALLFTLIWGLYLLTAPRTVILEDDGLFILSSWFLGIEHPPGYPLYILLGKLFTLWPFGPPAWRVHSLSALFAAAGCVLIFIIARILIPGRAAAYLSALGLGVSKTYWSQAVIADVYSLHALILFALLLISVLVRIKPDRLRQSGVLVKGAGLIAGLGMANHWPLFLLSAPGFALLWLPAWRQLLSRTPGFLFWFCVGLLPYAWMVWRSHALPPISFQGSIDSWGEFVDFFLRRGYVGIDNSGSAGIRDKVLFVTWLVRDAGSQMLLPGALLALTGFSFQWRRWGLLTSTAITLGFAGPTLALIILLNFDFDPLQREAFRVYPTAAWGLFALWAGLGLVIASERVSSSLRSCASALVAVLLIVATAVTHRALNDRSGEWLARDFATSLLSDLKPNAILLVRSDMHTPATAYLHLIEGLRPDVTVMNSAALVLEPRPFDPYTTPVENQIQIIDDNIQSVDRPLYRIPEEYSQQGTMSWLTIEVDPVSRQSATKSRFRLQPAERAFLIHLVSHGSFRDGWNELLRRYLLEAFAGFQAKAQLAGDWPTDDHELDQIAARVLTTPEAALARAGVLSDADHLRNDDEIQSLLERFGAQADSPWIDKRHLASFYNIIVHGAQLQGQKELARAAVRRSLHYWPGDQNPAFAAEAAYQRQDRVRQ
jgi:hypothetical protein